MKITVRTILSVILERELKMDDEIEFRLSEDTEIVQDDLAYKCLDIYLKELEIQQVENEEAKTLVFRFDLQEACLGS